MPNPNRIRRVVLCALACLMLTVAPVSAGSLEDPEVTDPEGDHWQGVDNDPFLAWDIRAIYFTEEAGLCDDATELSIAMQLGNILENNQGAPGDAFSTSVYFSIGGVDYRVTLRGAPNSDSTDAPAYTLEDLTAGSDAVTITGGVDNSGDEKVWWCVAYEALGGAAAGDTVSMIWGRTHMQQQGVLDVAPDGAPDSGDFGREYVLGGVVAVPANLTVAVRDADRVPSTTVDRPAIIPVEFVNGADANETVALNITSVSDGWDVDVGSGSVSVPVNNTTVVSFSLTPRDADAQDGEAIVHYQSSLGAEGNVTIRARVASMPDDGGGGLQGGPSGSDEDPGVEGNGTAANQTQGGDSPGIGGVVSLAAVGAALAAAARRRD